jgi:hypothetical protein
MCEREREGKREREHSTSGFYLMLLYVNYINGGVEREREREREREKLRLGQTFEYNMKKGSNI